MHNINLLLNYLHKDEIHAKPEQNWATTKNIVELFLVLNERITNFFNQSLDLLKYLSNRLQRNFFEHQADPDMFSSNNIFLALNERTSNKARPITTKMEKLWHLACVIPNRCYTNLLSWKFPLLFVFLSSQEPILHENLQFCYFLLSDKYFMCFLFSKVNTFNEVCGLSPILGCYCEQRVGDTSFRL